jgi:hypothetical protein
MASIYTIYTTYAWVALLIAVDASAQAPTWELVGRARLPQGVHALGVGVDSDGRVDVFALDRYRQLYHDWRAPKEGAWHGWEALDVGPASGGVPLIGTPTVATDARGRLAVFAVGVDGRVYYSEQRQPGWRNWVVLGTPPGAPEGGEPQVAAARDREGRLEAFAVGQDGRLYHTWQRSDTTWTDWERGLGAPVVGLDGRYLSVASNVDGRLEVFATGRDGAVWHIWQSLSGGGWSLWASLPARPAFPAEPVARDVRGALELFAVGPDGVERRWQEHPGSAYSNAEWHAWEPLGRPDGATPGEAVVAQNADGRLEVFVPGATGVVHDWQVTPGGAWRGWSSIAGGGARHIEAMTVARGADGALELFAADRSGAVWHVCQRHEAPHDW